MNGVLSADRGAGPRSRSSPPAVPDQDGGGAERPWTVEGASAMAAQCEISAPALGVGELDGEGFANLQKVGGPTAPLPLGSFRLRGMDLVVCDGAGLALYSLRMTSTTLSWEQRVISFPPVAELLGLRQRRDWARQARNLCLTSAEARACRVPVGVVVAEARGADEADDDTFPDREGSIYRLCEAAAARHQTLDKAAAKAGRLFLADVERARRPSHVPLRRLQVALAEELALGHSTGAICSRSEGFSDSDDESKVTELLCRRLGLLGHRVGGHVRYARVARYASAELLCEALDMAPEQVGL